MGKAFSALAGTEKQVAWAQEIRKLHIDALCSYKEMHPSRADEVEQIVDFISTIIEEASIFIDHRFVREPSHVFIAFCDLRDRTQKKYERKTLEERAVTEIIYTPSNYQEGAHTVHVMCQSQYVRVNSQKHADAIELLKLMAYTWNGSLAVWEKLCYGKEADRAAEVTARFIVAGFAVTLANEEARTKFETKSFERENHKRIFTNKERTHYIVRFPYNRHIQKELVTILNGYAIGQGNVKVTCARTDELLEFAEVHNFELSNAAIELANATPKRAYVTVNEHDLSDLLDDD